MPDVVVIKNMHSTAKNHGGMHGFRPNVGVELFWYSGLLSSSSSVGHCGELVCIVLILFL